MTSSILPKNNSKLTYVLPYPAWKATTSPFNSDRLPNLTIMHQLVGTLVKYGNSGRFEPYLADSWEVDPSGKNWIFRFRPNLFCEDGSPIEPVTYVRVLKRLLRSYAKNSPPVVFTKLEGWESFLAGKDDALGIVAKSNSEVTFSFQSKPLGLLDYLGMPYFGFYSEANFEGNEWKSSSQIISSGAYSLSKFDLGKEVVLKKRDEWFSLMPNSPETVQVLFLDFEEGSKIPAKNTLLVTRLDGSEALPAGYTQVAGVPTILTSIVLSPLRSTSPFTDLQFRRAFAKKLRDNQKLLNLKPGLSSVTQKFYPSWVGNETSVVQVNIKKVPVKNVKTLKVMLHSSMPAQEKTYTKKLLSITLDEFSLPYEFVPESEDLPIWEFDRTYDIRVPRVNVGGNLLSEAIRMMFCSRIGISFPDPSGRICQSTEQYESEQSSLSFQEYGDLFNRVLLEDAAVLPLFNTGWTWFLSPEVSPQGVSPSMAVPRFDLLELI